MIATEAMMAQILVRNLEDQVKGRLQHRAKRHGRSMEEEAREILRNALKEEEAPRRRLVSEIVALFQGQGIGLKEGEEIPEWRGYPVEPISFDE
jgi:plasmid stability protein